MKRIPLLFLMLLICVDSIYPQSTGNDFNKYKRCIDRNDIARAYKYIKKGYDINSRDYEGKTPLLYCLQQDKANIGRFFLKAGANINLTDYKGNSCLHYAIENCRSDDSIVYELIDRGANFRVSNNEGYTPLHFTILFSCYELPFYLINKGADFYLVTGLNESALHLSLESGCDTLSYFLLENDIDLRQRDNRGNTALLAAMDFRRHNVAMKLIEMGSHIDEFNNDSLDALFFAVVNQDTTLVKLLLEKGAQIKRPESQDPLIFFAANMEDAEIVKLLLLHGAENPDSCQENDKCFLSAFIYRVEANMVTDSLRTNYLRKSHDRYLLAESMYRKELNKVRASNTGVFFTELLTAAISEYSGTSYDPNVDYELERRIYLKGQIELCENNCLEIETLLKNNGTQELKVEESVKATESGDDFEIIEIP